MRLSLLLLVGLVLAFIMVVDRSPEPLSDESLDPCVTPLEWHVGAVDPRFDVSPRDVRQAMEEAARVWETAAGRPLFTPSTADGMTVNLVYDHRQESYEQLQPHESRIQDLGARAEALGDRVEALQARVEADRRSYERLGTDAAGRDYQNSVDLFNRAVDQYNLAADRYNEAVAAARAAAADAPRETMAGDLSWTTQTVNGRVVSVRRTLTVGLFGSYDELVLILTHELGHALGIDHVDDPAAVMAAAYRHGEIRGPVRLREADLAAFRRACPS